MKEILTETVCSPVDETRHDLQMVEELESRYVDVKTASLIQGCTTVAIYDLVERERLRVLKVFGKIVILISDLGEFKRQKPGPRLDK